MDSYGTDAKHMNWMAEWIRREGLSMPWSQSAQPNIAEATGAFEGDTGEQDAAAESLVKDKSGSFLDNGQMATSYDQEPGLSDFQDIIGPDWFAIQNGHSPMAPPPPRRQTPTAPIPMQKGRVDSEDELTDEDFVNLGSENRHRGATPDPNSISPQKRTRGNDGHYIRSSGPISTNQSRVLPIQGNRRMRQFQPRRARSTYDLHSQGGVQLHDDHGAPVYHGTTDIYGSPPLTRARATRMM